MSFFTSRSRLPVVISAEVEMMAATPLPAYAPHAAAATESMTAIPLASPMRWDPHQGQISFASLAALESPASTPQPAATAPEPLFLGLDLSTQVNSCDRFQAILRLMLGSLGSQRLFCERPPRGRGRVCGPLRRGPPRIWVGATARCQALTDLLVTAQVKASTCQKAESSLPRWRCS